jgi:tetratricopeptide (TPR) repeat protein
MTSPKHRPRTTVDAICSTNQDKALRALNQRLRETPTDELALYFRALIRSAKQDWLGAMADYDLAIQLSPDDPSLRFNCGLVAWRAGAIAKAEECFVEARRIDPTCEGAHYYLALVYERQGHVAEALALAQRALELRPTECSIGAAEFVALIDRLEESMVAPARRR